MVWKGSDDVVYRFLDSAFCTSMRSGGLVGGGDLPSLDAKPSEFD